MPHPPLGAINVFIGLLLAFFAGSAGLLVWAAVALPAAIRRRRVASRPQAPALGVGASGPGGRPLPGTPAYADGADLQRYPTRLEELEDRLRSSHAEAVEQSEHLQARGERVAAKSDRDALVERYAADSRMLSERAARMRRVLGTVWRTRVILGLRAHVAVTARARPDLSNLPEGEIPPERLDAAALRYEVASEAVHAYVIHIETRLADLSAAVPAPPAEAEVTAEDRAAVDDEHARARRTYGDLQNRMDRLADTLSYLSDRCTTRQVVHHTSQGVDGLEGSEGLLDEVSAALGALSALAEFGDRQLADTAMDNLAEDIGQLEQDGLDVKAEADAALEIARLLEQFPTPG